MSQQYNIHQTDENDTQNWNSCWIFIFSFWRRISAFFVFIFFLGRNSVILNWLESSQLSCRIFLFTHSQLLCFAWFSILTTANGINLFFLCCLPIFLSEFFSSANFLHLSFFHLIFPFFWHQKINFSSVSYHHFCIIFSSIHCIIFFIFFILIQFCTIFFIVNFNPRQLILFYYFWLLLFHLHNHTKKIFFLSIYSRFN